MKKVSTVRAKQSRDFSPPKLTIGLRDGNGVSALPIAWLQRSNHKGAGAT